MCEYKISLEVNDFDQYNITMLNKIISKSLSEFGIKVLSDIECEVVNSIDDDVLESMKNFAKNYSKKNIDVVCDEGIYYVIEVGSGCSFTDLFSNENIGEIKNYMMKEFQFNC